MIKLEIVVEQEIAERWVNCLEGMNDILALGKAKMNLSSEAALLLMGIEGMEGAAENVLNRPEQN